LPCFASHKPFPTQTTPAAGAYRTTPLARFCDALQDCYVTDFMEECLENYTKFAVVHSGSEIFPNLTEGMELAASEPLAAIALRCSMLMSKTEIKSRGVTLIELIVTVAIVGILAAIAMPNLYDVVKRDRLTNQANSLIGALNLARSEAIKRATRVTLCRSKSNHQGVTSVSCDGNSWSDGWIVFVDHAGAAGEFNASAGDHLLQRYASLEGDTRVSTPTGSGYTATSHISFTGTGLTEFVSATKSISAIRGRWLLCDRQKKPARLVDVGVGGRARIIDLTDQKTANNALYKSLQC
jgi:type IV fimbrial biogenesis protein FimT